MSFFKKYNGTTNQRLTRLETLIWTMIYGGLLSALIGWFMRDSGDAGGLWLMGIGGTVVLVGFILFLVRTRLHEGPDGTGRASVGKRPS